MQLDVQLLPLIHISLLFIQRYFSEKNIFGIILCIFMYVCV